MKERLEHSLKFNNGTVNTEKEFTLRSTQGALYLLVMGGAPKGNGGKVEAPKK